jgi:hypothetical protein
MTLVETIRRIALLFQLEVQFASFSIFVCVARIFDRHLSGTVEAGKLLARGNSVKSGMAQWQCEAIDRFPAAIALLLRQARAKIGSGFSFLFSLGDARFFFLVKKILGRDENKISNKAHFFLVDFESDF